MEFLDFLTTGQKFLGVILGLIALIGMIVRTFWKRVSRQVDDGVSDLKVGHGDVLRRLNDVEVDVGQIKDDLTLVKERVTNLDRRMSQDIHEVNVKLARIETTNDRTSNMVDTLYRGVLDRAEKGR